MSLVRWNPTRERMLLSQPSAIDRMFDELSRQFFGEFGRFAPIGMGADFPAIDVLTEGEDLIIRAELPGIDPERDVEVVVQDGSLFIRGERRFENQDNNGRYHRVERTYGSFSRSFPLPAEFDASAIKASYNNGVLELVAPGVVKQPQSQRIPIQVGQSVAAGSLEHGEAPQADDQ